MSMTCRRVLALVGLVVGFASLAAMALPGFSDRNIARGNLNPTDTIDVQEIRITPGGEVTLNAVTVQNIGTAGDGVIDRIAVMDGGNVLGETTAISGLATGVTINLDGFTINTTHDLKIFVTVGTAVTGGETINLRTRVHYVSGGSTYTSEWISDLSGETIRNGGFDVIDDTSPDPGYFNPGDTGVVQVTVFSDTDANGNPVMWTGTNPIVKVENLGTAVNADVQTLSVTISGGTWQATASKTNVVAGSFNAGEFTELVTPPAPALNGQAVPDNGTLTVTLRMTFAAGLTDSRTVHTKVTLYVVETGESAAEATGSPVAYSQSSTADTTQTLRKQGFERIVEESTSLSSGTAATSDVVVQTVRCYDSDSNALGVTATQIYIRNTGTAEGTEINKIEVKAGATSLFTIDNSAAGHALLPNFKTGAWYNITDFAVADDHDQVFKIYYTIGTPVDGHTLKPSVRVEGNEGGPLYSSDEVTYPDTLILRLPGLEFVENMTPPTGGAAYSGQRLFAQQIHVRDLDEQINNVTINPIVVKNIGTATSTDVVKVEIWRQNTLTATEVKLGETTDMSGFRTGGARVELTHDNVLVDTASGVEAYLNVYLTMAEPEVMVAARTIQLETRVLHTENLQSFDKMAPSNQWTLATNHRPVVDFTFAAATGTASAQAKADFTYEQTIQFTGTATDSDKDAIASWAWTFGDGSTASVQNPTHRYPNGGTFTVTLTVTDARGVTGSKSKTITVQGPPNVAPTATFTWTPQAPAQAQAVTFTSTVTDPDQPTGTAFTYAWDFGDTTTSTVANPQHAFANKQTYAVKLIVTDAQSASVTVEHTVSVGNTAPVIGTLTASEVTPNTGDSVTFTVANVTDADVGDTIASLKWTFGDGATLTTQWPTATVTHTFNAPAMVTVSVIAVDSRGGESLPKTMTITVSGPTRVIVYAYPNPASIQATFNLLLPDGTTDPVLRIFRIDGRLVLEEDLGTGTTDYLWNLLDTGGDPVGNGLYFCIVTGTAAGGGTVRSDVFRLLIVR
jgi:PKD repeat protein